MTFEIRFLLCTAPVITVAVVIVMLLKSARRVNASVPHWHFCGFLAYRRMLPAALRSGNHRYVKSI